MQYRTLDVEPIVDRIAHLRVRTEERFPRRGLVGVCRALEEVGRETPENLAWIRRPIVGLRLGVAFALLMLIAGGVVTARTLVLAPAELLQPADLVQVIDAVFNEIILVTGALVFLVRTERRVKQKRTLAALHGLRTLAHVIDTHQLTKDPDRAFGNVQPTASSPREDMTPDALVRYLNHCAEMLSLIGKLAALYAQNFDDAVVIAGVTEVEDLSLGLSHKIWQKIMVVQQGIAALKAQHDGSAGPRVERPSGQPLP